MYDRLSKLFALIAGLLLAAAGLALQGCAQKERPTLVLIVIDTLRAAEKQAMKSPVLEQLGLQPQGYGLLTLHRPSNVDQPTKLRELLETLADLCGDMPLVFPVHPRTRARLDAAGLELQPPLWRVCEPVGYLDFLKLMAAARVALTDSGGRQE